MRSKAINQREGANNSTQHNSFDNNNRGGRNTSGNGRGITGGRGSNYCCNK